MRCITRPSTPRSEGYPYAEADRQCSARDGARDRTDARLGSAAPGPYAGGGLNIAHASVTGVSGSGATKAGLNLLGGTTFKVKRSTLTPFVEGRGEIGGGKTFILTGGVRF